MEKSYTIKHHYKHKSIAGEYSILKLYLILYFWFRTTFPIKVESQQMLCLLVKNASIDIEEIRKNICFKH